MGTETSENWQRVNLLNVPIDIIAPDQLSNIIYDLIKDKKEHNIVLLSLWDLLRARRNNEYRSYVTKASLVIPISKSLISGIKFLVGEKAYRYMPFDFIISMLSILEKREFSCYLLGGKRKILLKTEQNLRQTFPKLRQFAYIPCKEQTTRLHLPPRFARIRRRLCRLP